MTADGRSDIKVTGKLAGMIWRVYGLAQAFEALGGDKPASQLPGFSLARALIEKELADQRAIMSGEVYRTAARAGHDIARCSAIFTTIKDGVPCVQIESADLVEQAESER